MSSQLHLDFKLQPKQTLLNHLCENSKASFIGFGGSRGGAKSGGLRRIMLLRRLKYPGTTGLIFRRVYDDLKRNHIDKFFEDFPSLYKYYRSSDHELVLPSADGKAPSRIVFGYAETETELKRKFHGPEYMDMFIDQAEQLSEFELKTMKLACRWPGFGMHQCKFVVFFNPGGKSVQYFRRVFKTKSFRGSERPDDFAFIQAYGWDNVEWCRSALIEDGLTEEDFYSWDNDTRFDYFITRSQYGRDLDQLPAAMRIGHLMGSLDTFAGQFFDIWNPDGPMVKSAKIEPWYTRWISVDWGFAHDAAVQWHAQDGKTTRTYREYVVKGKGPRQLAEIIVAKSLTAEGNQEGIDAVYLSPDAFAKRTNEDTIAQQMSAIFVAAGLPAARQADNDRVSGWVLMYEMLRTGEWVIDPCCEKLIENIPLFTRQDEKDNPEDCVKFEGDDPGDAARYGLKSRFSAREKPKNIQLAEALDSTTKRISGKTDDLGALHTAMHLDHLKFNQAWSRSHRPVRMNRRWRPSV